MIRDVTALVLAGGASRRMGTPKPMLAWGKRTVLGHILEQIRGAGIQDIQVVSGAHHDVLSSELKGSQVHLSRNPEWTGGMGSSTVWGVREIQKRVPHCRGILILLADQPLVDAGYLNQMLQVASSSPGHLVGSAYPQGPGVPAFFPQEYFGALSKLSLEEGAKKILRDPAYAVTVLDAGYRTRDMDTPEAYEALKKQYSDN